jgi:hypothetical protein
MNCTAVSKLLGYGIRVHGGGDYVSGGIPIMLRGSGWLEDWFAPFLTRNVISYTGTRCFRLSARLIGKTIDYTSIP